MLDEGKLASMRNDRNLLRNFLIVPVVLASLAPAAQAGIDQCPKLRGIFDCPAVAGASEQTTILISESRHPRWVTYDYTWEELGKRPEETYYVANEDGRRQPNDWSLLGRCIDGFFFVAPYGEAKDDTRLIHINHNGDYEAVRFGDRKVAQVCKRLR